MTGPGPAPEAHKLTFQLGEVAALALEADLVASEHPLLLAVTRFESGPGWQVDAYFAEPVAWSEIAGLTAGSAGLRPDAAAAIEPRNWVAHVESVLAPVAAGRFLVHGPHDRAKAAGHPWAIEIEAGLAFGTAHHPTTVGCLRAIDRLLPGLAPPAALDLGTGTGVLAIAMAKALGRGPVLASDIDEVAVEVARENCALNGVADRVEVLVADGLAEPRLARAGHFGLIAANILAPPLIALARPMAEATAPGGRLILSGLLAEQAAAVQAAYEAAGCRLVEAEIIAGWATLDLAR